MSAHATSSMDWYYTGTPEPVANDLASLPHYSSISMVASRKAGGGGAAEGDDGDEGAASASSSRPSATVALSTPVSLPMNEKSDKITGFEAPNLTSTAGVAVKAQFNADGRLRAGYIRTQCLSNDWIAVTAAESSELKLPSWQTTTSMLQGTTLIPVPTARPSSPFPVPSGLRAALARPVASYGARALAAGLPPAAATDQALAPRGPARGAQGEHQAAPQASGGGRPRSAGRSCSSGCAGGCR